MWCDWKPTGFHVEKAANSLWRRCVPSGDRCSDCQAIGLQWCCFYYVSQSMLSPGNSHASPEELLSENNSIAWKIERNESQTKNQLTSYCFFSPSNSAIIKAKTLKSKFHWAFQTEQTKIIFCTAAQGDLILFLLIQIEEGWLLFFICKKFACCFAKEKHSKLSLVERELTVWCCGWRPNWFKRW